MRVLVVFAHPVAESFGAAVHRTVIEALRRAGHEVVDLDLYREGFQPALTRDERLAYYREGENTATIRAHVDQLLWAEGLVLCFPVWWNAVPAILKGYFDRVWVPGVAFEVSEGGLLPLRPGLTNIRKLGVATTYGAPWWFMKLYMGDPVRRILLRGIKPLLARGAAHLYVAGSDMDRAGPARRRRFLDKVDRAFARF